MFVNSSQVLRASATFDLRFTQGVLDAMCTVLGMYRLIELMLPLLPPAENRTQPMYVPIVRGLSTVTLKPWGAIKRIANFQTFSIENYVTQEGLKLSYQVAAEAAIGNLLPFLVTLKEEPEVILSRHRTCFTVSTTPLGYFSRPRDEQVRLTEILRRRILVTSWQS